MLTLKVDLEEDQKLRSYIKQIIEGQVRSLLREQLSGVIAGEIAKLRILQPDSTTLSAEVERQVNAAVSRVIASTMHAHVQKAVNEMAQPALKGARELLKRELMDQISRM